MRFRFWCIGLYYIETKFCKILKISKFFKNPKSKSNTMQLPTLSNVHTTHHSFQPWAGPAQSKYLAHKWDNIKYQIHRKNLTEVKKQIDNNIPYTNQLVLNDVLRKQQIKKIDHDNEKLVKKMTEINERKEGGSGSTKISEKNNPPKRFTGHRNYHFDCEMKKIMKENKRLLNKIVVNEPMYNTNVLKKDFEDRHVKFANNISRFPDRNKLKRSTSLGKKSLLVELEK